MVTVAYNAYCVISMEGDDDTSDGKTAGSPSWEVEATVNSLVGTLFHVIITRMGTDLIFLSRQGSTICFTNFGSHDPIVLYWNPWYTEPCYKGSLLYIHTYTMCLNLIVGFPAIIGAIDCMHVKIKAPPRYLDENAYVDRHGTHSLNVQVIYMAITQTLHN